MNISNKINTILDLWVKLTNVNPESKTYKLNLFGEFGETDVRKMYSQVKEILELDSTGIIALNILDYYISVCMENYSFSINDILFDNTEYNKSINIAKEINNELYNEASPEILIQPIIHKILESLKAYNLDILPVLDMLEKREIVAFCFKDALKSINTLRCNQFLKGEFSTDTPQYSKVICQFNSIDELLEMAYNQPSGISLNIINDINGYYSYFAFAIRNGENVFLLTDNERPKQPFYKYQSRRPDRNMDNRVNKHWFPYGLINKAFVEEGSKIETTALSKHKQIVSTIDKISPREILWLVLMFDLIVDKFWKKKHQEEELSYTNRIIPNLELGSTNLNLPVQYTSFKLPDISIETIKSIVPDDISPLRKPVKTEEQTNTGFKYSNYETSRAKWLYDRYKNKVKGNHLFVKSADEGKSHFLHSSIQWDNNVKDYVSTDIVDDLLLIDENALACTSNSPVYPLSIKPVDSIEYGTVKEIDADRKFIARYNLASDMQRYINNEFYARKQEIIDYMKSLAEKNIKHIYCIAIEHIYSIAADESSQHRKIEDKKQFLEYIHTIDFNERIVFHKGFSGSRRLTGLKCYITGKEASYYITLKCSNYNDLCYVYNCTVNELPDVLQTWNRQSDYFGNDILDRIDPVASRLIDPWQHFDLSIILALSKTGMKNIKKINNFILDIY